MTQHPLRLIIPLVILILVGIASWYVLSRPLPPTPEEPTPIGEMRETTETITENGLYHEIKADYPARTRLSGSANETAVASMRGFLAEEIIAFKENSGLNSLTPQDIALFGLGGERKYAYGAEYRTFTGDHTVSYVFDIYVDTLGAHPNGYHKTFTFDLETGAELSVWSLFLPETNYLEILSQIARSELPESIATKSGIPVSDVNIDYINDGTTPMQANFDDFYFDGDDLVVIFQPYQVGPWVIGTQELRIPKSALVNILKSEYR